MDQNKKNNNKNDHKKTTIKNRKNNKRIEEIYKNYEESKISIKWRW